MQTIGRKAEKSRQTSSSQSDVFVHYQCGDHEAEFLLNIRAYRFYFSLERFSIIGTDDDISFRYNNFAPTSAIIRKFFLEN